MYINGMQRIKKSRHNLNTKSHKVAGNAKPTKQVNKLKKELTCLTQAKRNIGQL